MSSTHTSSSRRKGRKSHYVVVKGRDISKPTIFKSWEDAKIRIENFSGGEYKGFFSEVEAEDYIYSLRRTAIAEDAGKTKTGSTEDKPLEASTKVFYAVYKGRQTGIFTSWAEASEQINGFSGHCHKKFKTEEEARRFVDRTHTSKVMGKTPDVLGNVPSKLENIPRRSEGDADQEDLPTVFIQLNLQSV
ncbi:unnamed protein product [Clonostachys byssicola]|uniref:ribonuclease H n=1 Tax=Clonostachys byssicola TaxID=160290 RepID=A0A9N9UF37_9HYPO|nr:unnamed protein product [Clonostachys byssicola]